MNQRFDKDSACFNAALEAGTGRMAGEDVAQAFDRLVQYREALEANGNTTGISGRVGEFAKVEGERAKLAAAIQKRHAALNVLVKHRQEAAIDAYIQAGLSPRQALLAILEGTQKGVVGGRVSVAARTNAYESRYLGGLFAEIQRDRPQLIHMMRDQKFDADVAREMGELHESGTPGITGNADAQYLAKAFSKFAELSRADLNSFGASVEKLTGWAGAQVHDDVKMIRAGKGAWTDFVKVRLDLGRTFSNVSSDAEVTSILGDIFDTLITGVPVRDDMAEAGVRRNPANLAKTLGKSRVLHFKNANDAMTYRAEFGYGNTVSGVTAHLRRAARMAAVIETLGPNPEFMFERLVDGLEQRTRVNASLSSAARHKQIKGLRVDAGRLKHALDIATGLISKPVNVDAARIASDIRAVQSMAKLGGAVISSIPDTVSAAAASQFRGGGMMRGLVAQLDGLRRGRPKQETAEITYLLGEGFDGIIGQIVHPAAAQDGPVGTMSRLQETFFRWNGLTWWTDVQRGVAARVIAAEMGMRTKTAFAKLPDNYRHVLSLHGIDANIWEAIRGAGIREIEGKRYLTPDLIAQAPDSVIAKLAGSKLDGADTARRAEIMADQRRELEMTVRAFVADETGYAVPEVDARSKRTLTLGQRPGTIAGEAARFIFQFKGFPVSFIQRVGGRALFGHHKDASMLDRTAHIGTLLAGMTMAGYMSLTLNDMLRGQWPPRDVTDPKVILAAMLKGGALGLYGDFFFSEANRYGSSPLETIIGPTIGTASSVAGLWMQYRDFAGNVALGKDEDAPLAASLNLLLQNTPGASLFYVRPVMDYLWLNSLREAASPGYLRRQETRRRREYGQERLLPATAF